MTKKIFIGLLLFFLFLGVYFTGYFIGLNDAFEDIALEKCWKKDTDIVCIHKIYDRKE